MDAYQSNAENQQDYLSLCHSALLAQQEGGARPDLSARLKEIAAREELAPAGLPIAKLRQLLQLDGPALFCVVFSLSCELDPALRSQVYALCGVSLPTFELAFALYGGPPGTCPLAEPVLSPLRFLLLLETGTGLPLTLRPLALRKNILRFLLCGAVTGGGAYSLAQPAEDVLSIQREHLDKLCCYIQSVQLGSLPSLVVLSGASGSGRSTLVRRACTVLGLPCLVLDLRTWTTLDAAACASLCLELATDAVLCGGAICLTHYNSSLALAVDTLLAQIPAALVPVFLLTTEDLPSPDGWTVLHQAIGPLSLSDAQCVQEALSARFPVKTPPPPGNMTAGRLIQLWLDADNRRRALKRAYITPLDLAQAAQACTQAVAHPLTSPAVLNDLVAEPALLDQLTMICSLLRASGAADALYQAAGQTPPGQGLTALFYGPPGTGKTMAACALANELGVPLLRIDLSRVLDKYIGETEKHLSEAFSLAAQQGSILFFDEADSLFSKRTEVSSSNDRYANIETAYLLQSIEAFEGAVLLATNLLKNIDQAFLRRVTVSVHFSLPNEALRLELWRRAFPPAVAPQQPRLLPILARELELPPATICAAARLAVTLAAGAKTPVTPSLLLTALENELGKYGQQSKLAALRTQI